MNVQNNKFALLLAASAVSLALTGCGGDDGTPGNPGNPGGPAADVVNVLTLDVTEVKYENSVPTVTVFATNEEDLPVVGLKDLKIENAAQLIPQSATNAGDSANWQKLGSSSTFTDNKNGSYQFTFDSFNSDTFNEELTQRFNVVAKASTLQDGVTSVPVSEIVEDFDGQGYQAKYTKNIVSHEACTACHAEDETIYHKATTLDTCVTCHTQEWADGRGKPEVAFSHLVHNVHNSNKEWGRNDYTAEKAHGIVQDNCQACHIEPEADSNELAEWGNWSRVPTMEVCTSCHVGIDFKAGEGHSQQNDNSNCIACHNASWTEEIHLGGFAEKKAFIDMYAMEATLTAVATDSGSDTTLSVSITNADGTAIDAATLITSIKQLETITNVGPNFPVMGYQPNPVTGEEKVILNLVKDGVIDKNTAVIDGKLVTTIADLPYGAGDTDTAFSFVGLALCNDGSELVACGEGVASTGMKAELAHGTLSGEAPSVRHTDSVNFAACESCHGTEWELHEKYHAGFVMTDQLGRVNDAGEMVVGIDGCASCHTPDGVGYSGQGLAIEMRLHKTHGFGKDSDDNHAVIDYINCSQCHSSFNTDAFKVKSAFATDGGYTTPIAATCYSCHNTGGDKFKNHAEGQGAIVNGSFEAANDAAQLETCFMCHNPSIENHTSVKM